MPNLSKRFPVYSKLIYLYPAQYQKEYGQQMLQTTADMLDNAKSSHARALIWSRIMIDLPINITRQQLEYTGGMYMHDTPHYIKISSFISSILLLPFFAALSANGLDKVLRGHTLFNSWLWKTPVIGLWIIYLPLAAFFLAAISYVVYVTQNKKPKLNRMIDIRRVWMLLIPAVIAFGILFIVAFHDSVQCWVQSPSHLVSHMTQAWQCSENNQSLKIFTNFPK